MTCECCDDVEHDVRRDADHLRGLDQPEELPVGRGRPVGRRRRQLRAADGVDARRAGQARGLAQVGAGQVRRAGGQDQGPGEGAGLAPQATQPKPTPGTLHKLHFIKRGLVCTRNSTFEQRWAWVRFDHFRLKFTMGVSLPCI